MVYSGVIYGVIAAVLTIISILIHVSNVSLFLPSIISFITIFVPIVAAIHSYYYPKLVAAARRSPIYLEKLFPGILQALQGIALVVLSTLVAQNTGAAGVLLDCALSSKWQDFFAHKDEAAIRQIQETLRCCGFRTVKDRAWPFPPGGTVSTCANSHEHVMACLSPWMATLRRNAGGELGVLVAVGLVQIFTLVWTSGSAQGKKKRQWAPEWMRWAAHAGHPQDQQRRSLLAPPQEGEVEETDEEDNQGPPSVGGQNGTSAPGHYSPYGTA